MTSTLPNADGAAETVAGPDGALVAGSAQEGPAAWRPTAAAWPTPGRPDAPAGTPTARARATASPTPAGARARIDVTSHLHRQRVDLVRRVAGALVDAKHRVARRPGREAEDLARDGVEPRPLEVHALVTLDREVAFVGLLELLRRHADEA